MTSRTTVFDPFPWLTGNDEMTRRARELDWSTTPMGPVESWPAALRTTFTTSLNCAFPIVTWWGPELAFLYNEEYRPSLGAKHPSALGQPGAAIWAEIWDVIGPMLARVMEHAEATRSRDQCLFIERHGYLEETYWSFSYSPIFDESGKVGGVYCPVIETTEKVIAERRLRTLRDLAAECKGSSNEVAAYASAAKVLAANLHDVPFALIYRIEQQGSVALLEVAAGIDAAASAVMLQSGGSSIWSLERVARTGEAVVLSDLSSHCTSLPTAPWDTSANSALVLPLSLPGQEHPHAILVVGVSPMRALDADYRTFFELVATQIAAGLADARALEEERRRALALAEIDRAKTAFFSNVSHEFRTPLTLILGPLEDALAATTDSVQRERLELLRRNARRLQKLVNSLLDFSRIEAGRMQANYEPTDLATFTAELASVFRSAVEAAGMRLIVDCAPLVEPVSIDRDMYEKIVLNLLSNAFKFTLEGEIEVRLQDAGEMVELSVRDTGSGIASTELPHVFERFHRVEGARARTQEGTGIGLAFVQELARLHGGVVTVESVVNAGTVFTVSFPKVRSHLPADPFVPVRATSALLEDDYLVEEALGWLPAARAGDNANTVAISTAGAAATRARIVLADDNADMRDYVGRLLGVRYDVEAVANGNAALAAVHRQHPDLVLSDVMMPGLDGFGLLRALRDDERTCSIPLILLSARAGEEARVEGMQAGADDYLVKPFSARELLARVDAHIAMAKQRRESEIRYRTLFDSIDEGYCIIRVLFDESGKAFDYTFDEVNQSFARQTGVDNAVGRSMLEIEPTHDAHWFETYGRIVTTGQPERFISEASALRRWYDVYAFRIGDVGQHRVAVLFHDITEQKNAEAALREADRRKDEFLATLAHELRNPLAPIRNGLHILRSASDLSGNIATVHEMMEGQVNHMVRLVDDLMEVSRITGGKIELRKEQIELAAILLHAVETSRPLIEAAHHRLAITLPDEPLLLDADPVRLAQIIANMLNNAAKYTDEGGQIWLTAYREGSSAILSVRDTGVGIPQDMLPKVFDLFTQVERTYDRAQGGLGIGLTLVRSLVELHGGQVEATSAGLGRGSEFVVRLPLPQQLAPAAQAPPVARQSTTPPRRILVVDDNRDAGDTLGMILQLLGADTYIARDGPAALEALRNYRPDVVLLDIGLPGMDGYEVARRARQQPENRDVTLIAVTGWGQEEDRRRSREAGIDHHLVKPVDIAALEQLLATLPVKRQA